MSEAILPESLKFQENTGKTLESPRVSPYLINSIDFPFSGNKFPSEPNGLQPFSLFGVRSWQGKPHIAVCCHENCFSIEDWS